MPGIARDRPDGARVLLVNEPSVGAFSDESRGEQPLSCCRAAVRIRHFPVCFCALTLNFLFSTCVDVSLLAACVAPRTADVSEPARSTRPGSTSEPRFSPKEQRS